MHNRLPFLFRKPLIAVFGLLCIAAFLLVVTTPVTANPQPQVYYQTPTPDADGRIVYVVQTGDSCLQISLLTGVDLNTLQSQNDLDAACTLVVGQQLLLGLVETPAATAGPAPTETPAGPTPTPFSGSGQVCVFLFNDVNGNSLPETGETQIEGGAVAISERGGSLSLTGETETGLEPLCFEDLAEGDYNISVAPPEGYNPTTSMNYPLQVRAGDSTVLDFGAQVSSQGPAAGAAGADGQGTSPLLAILGGVLIAGGLGLAYYFYMLRKSSL